MAAIIDFKHVNKYYGKFHALKDINLTKDSSGNPLIELGSSNSSFRVMITNTSIDFMDGSLRIAYISKDALNITSATVSKEFKIGDVNGSGYIWQKRPNNHLGLRYVSS